MEINKKSLYILTLVTMVLHTNDAQTDAITGFTCNQLGQMNMTVPNWVTRVKVLCTAKGTTTPSPSPTVQLGAVTLENHNVTIVNCKKDSIATLFMFEQITAPSTDTPLIGTHQKAAQVALTCTSTSGSDWTDTVQFQINGPTLPGISATETIGQLSTELLKSTNNFAQATEVSLGDSYIIIISGEEPYYKKVQSCNASSTEGDFESGIEVLKNTVNVLDNATISKLKNQSKSHTPSLLPHDIFLSLTGFRLVGSTTVYLQCSVDICKSECTRRKKRSTTPSNVRYATMKFEVKDEILDTSSSGIKGIHSTTRSFVLLFIVTALRYQTI